MKIKTLRHELYLRNKESFVFNDEPNKELEDLLNEGWEIIKIDHFDDWQEPQIRICTLIKKEM